MKQPYVPISWPPARRRRLWPRTRRINRHAVDRALHIAAWGSHTCRPFPAALIVPALAQHGGDAASS